MSIIRTAGKTASRDTNGVHIEGVHCKHDVGSIITYILCSGLSNNPLVCDCDAMQLYNLVITNQLSGPVCQSPDSVRGRYLQRLLEEVFCGKGVV